MSFDDQALAYPIFYNDIEANPIHDRIKITVNNLGWAGFWARHPVLNLVNCDKNRKREDEILAGTGFF
ncbi:hypothetical protein ZMO01_14620 [Zymomonas mobilis subsp. mobilis]|nr:hypothetical protein B9T50_05410 [Zymomonas mobilis subsp. mobilis]GEB88122.1 hypothetical protein ZMO01_14620 [Zymomonas mobilis subsp. mobilis]HCE37663.1 hypothetical protein [Zymomonas mobilis]